ncbi:MAG: metal-sulfur cluster assembly factor [Frankia sp.]
MAETAATEATAPQSAAPQTSETETSETEASETSIGNTVAVGEGIASLEEVEEAMRDVVDPELGINVVDLGLLYGTHIHGDRTVTLDMTLTSAACPLTDVIEDQARSALTSGPEALATDLKINWVWMPPWGPDKITDDGREQLRALGFNV